jgi:hypothetical protein
VNNSNFVTYYSLEKVPVDISGFIFFLVISLLFSTILFWFFTYEKKDKKYKTILSPMRLIIVYIIVIFSNYAYYKVSIYYPNYYKAVLKNNKCNIVEGKVHNFRQKIQGKSGLEDFFIHDIKFVLSENDGQVGFKQTSDNGGPIRENLLVKICYFEEYPHNLILKLDIASKN